MPGRVCCLRVAGNQSGAAGARSAKCTLSVRDRGTNTGKLYEHARKNVQELTELSVVFVCHQQEIAKRRKGMKGYRDNVYLFQADWHVDQRQYDVGDPCFRRALAKSAAGHERAIATSDGAATCPARAAAPRNTVVNIPHSILLNCAGKAEITEQRGAEDHLKTNRSSLLRAPNSAIFGGHGGAFRIAGGANREVDDKCREIGGDDHRRVAVQRG